MPDDEERDDDGAASREGMPREGATRDARVSERAGAALEARAGETRGGDDELPVVARLVVEVRSDGSRTIARGGIEDLGTGQRVTIDARGDSPALLAMALARSIFKIPQLAARMSVRGLLGRGRRGRGGGDGSGGER